MLLIFGFWCYFINWSGVFALDKKDRPKNSFPKLGIQTPWIWGSLHGFFLTNLLEDVSEIKEMEKLGK